MPCPGVPTLRVPSNAAAGAAANGDGGGREDACGIAPLLGYSEDDAVFPLAETRPRPANADDEALPRMVPAPAAGGGVPPAEPLRHSVAPVAAIFGVSAKSAAVPAGRVRGHGRGRGSEAAAVEAPVPTPEEGSTGGGRKRGPRRRRPRKPSGAEERAPQRAGGGGGCDGIAAAAAFSSQPLAAPKPLALGRGGDTPATAMAGEVAEGPVRRGVWGVGSGAGGVAARVQTPQEGPRGGPEGPEKGRRLPGNPPGARVFKEGLQKPQEFGQGSGIGARTETGLTPPRSPRTPEASLGALGMRTPGGRLPRGSVGAEGSTGGKGSAGGGPSQPPPSPSPQSPLDGLGSSGGAGLRSEAGVLPQPSLLGPGLVGSWEGSGASEAGSPDRSLEGLRAGVGGSRSLGATQEQGITPRGGGGLGVAAALREELVCPITQVGSEISPFLLL